MAKIRVYELAKKLNLTNKALLTKLKALDIEVKSHMSSLEDEAVIQVKESLFGQKNKVAETRVRSFVIRRRKRRKVEAAQEMSQEEVKDLPEPTDLDVKRETKGVEKPQVKDEHLRDQVLEEAPAEVEAGMAEQDQDNSVEAEQVVPESALPEDEEGPADEEGIPVKADIPSEDEIVDESIEASEPESDVVEDQESVTAEVDQEEPGTSPVIDDVSDISDQEEIIEESVEEDQPGEELSVEAANKESISEEVSSVEVKVKPASEGKDKKKKKKGRQKKSEPAKIIRLAKPPVIKPKIEPAPSPEVKAEASPERQAPAKGKPFAAADSSRGNEAGAIPEAAKPVEEIRKSKSKVMAKPVIVPPIEEAVDLEAKAKRKKEKKKKIADADFDDFQKKGAFKKRKAVVEGKDLYEDGGRGGKRGRKKDSRSKKAQIQKTQITVPKAIKRRVKIDETIELSELAKRMGIKANEMIVKLMGLGVMATVNQTIDFDTAALVAAEFDYEVEKASFEEEMLINVRDMEDDNENLIERPPVVTIMGHVDHGKTSLLDVIRKSRIVTGEAGGITQHIGAYSVKTPSGKYITFLDTPGHEAFTSMRSRGAKVTDLVVLVVAADDGVMPQTVEAINHSKAANVPVVVAVNKMDKPGANPDKVMRELSDHGLLAEEWGGDVIFAKVSAKAETGIEDLLEMILLQAEVLELKANPDRLATGHVVEARLDAGRGPVATILIEQGTLKQGEPVVCGLHAGRIRVMIDDTGQNVDSAGPSKPVEVVGLSGVPDAGDEVVALTSEKDAKQISAFRMQKKRAKELAKKSRANLEKLFDNMGSDEIKELKLIVKADVHGSIEALNESIMKLAQDEVEIKIVHSGTGAINESDVSLAAVSDAIIIGFNVRPTPKVRAMAKEENVDMRFYDIIYNVINDIKAAITGLMPSTFHEIILGRAEVRDTFVIPNKGTIAGSYILEGKFTRGDRLRLLRDGVVKCDSVLSSLRRFKDDVKEVNQGYECGIGLEKFNDIKVGDIFECYEMEERKATMESMKE